MLITLIQGFFFKRVFASTKAWIVGLRIRVALSDMLSMKDDSGVIFINDKSRNIGELMHYVCSCIGRDTPIPSRGYGRVHSMAGQQSLCFA